MALCLGPDLGRDALAATRRALGPAARGLRLPREGGLHLTLSFLGDVDRDRRASLEALLAALLGGARAPRLELAGAGAFPAGRPGRERVLWVGVREVGAGGRLEGIHGRVLEAVGRAGLAGPDAGRFHPHVTVGRPRRGTRVPSSFYELGFSRPWSPREVTLVRSLRGNGARRYEPAASFALGRS